MQGRRHDIAKEDFWPDDEMQQLDYGKDGKGRWWVWPPGCNPVLITGHGDRDWKVQEHEDGTITVSPSIFYNPPHGWHGFLEKGIWRSC